MNIQLSKKYRPLEALCKITVIVWSAIFIAGCTSKSDLEADRAMEIAETVMEEHPDSALTILEAIPTEDLSGERRRALHALLLTQARDKNYIDQTSDTLISPAVAYFDTSDDAYHRMLAHFYLSTIYYYADEYSKASLLVR